MRVCPTCNRSYEEPDALVCGIDGARLVDTTKAARRGVEVEPGQTIGGRYVLGPRLGAGGMGEVFNARQTSVGREVAIKVLAPELASDLRLAKRFLREVRAVSAVRHPNVVTIHDFGQTEAGVLYLVMEKVAGEPLSWLLRRTGPLAPRRAVRIADQILDALETAHEQGIHHRDLKPDNVLIGEHNHGDFVTILDFGIAAIEGDDGTALTKTGMLCGTPDYMAPERACGEVSDHRADLYAVGVLLYEMLAGHVPFEAESVVEVLTKHLREKPPPIGVAPQIEAVVMRALAKKPERRFENATQMRRALRKGFGTWEQSLGGEVPRPPELSRARSDRRPAIVAGLGLAVVAGLALAFALTKQEAPAPAPDAAAPTIATVKPVDASPPPVDAARPPPDARPIPEPAKPVRKPKKKKRRPRVKKPRAAAKPAPAPAEPAPFRSRINDLK